MNKVVSIALFGEGNDYAQYLRSFVRAHLNLFPLDEGWKLYVHTDLAMASTATGALINRLDMANLIHMQVHQEASLCRAMLWRMDPVFSEDVDYVFCRDLDALPLPRDRAVCEQFMKSNCHVGTAHDNIYHTGIMGGLCHFQTKPFRETMKLSSLDDLYTAASFTDEQWSTKGADQVALNRLVLANSNIHLLEHRFSGWAKGMPGVKGREAGSYACQAWSTPVPDQGQSKFAFTLAMKAERLAGHLGAAGYDHEAAARFYDEHGDPEITRRVRMCEESPRR